MLLSACSAKRPAQPPLTFRTALLQSGGCSFSAAITADYGDIDATGTEDGLLRTTYRMGYEEKELVVDTWFSQEPLAPVRAELSFEGRMVLRADISAFSMKSTEE